MDSYSGDEEVFPGHYGALSPVHRTSSSSSGTDPWSMSRSERDDTLLALGESATKIEQMTTDEKIRMIERLGDKTTNYQDSMNVPVSASSRSKYASEGRYFQDKTAVVTAQKLGSINNEITSLDDYELHEPIQSVCRNVSGSMWHEYEDESDLEDSGESLLKKTRSEGEGEEVNKMKQVSIEMEKKEFVFNIIAVLLISVIGEASRGLVMVTLPLYMGYIGGAQIEYTLSVSFFSVGRLLGGIAFGAMSHKYPMKYCVMVAMSICACGNLMYFLAILGAADASAAPDGVIGGGAVIALVARTIVGFGSSNVVLVRAFVAQITSLEDRTRYVGWSNAAQFIGSSVLSGAGMLLLTLPTFDIGPIEVSGYNSPGLVLVLLDIICVLTTYFMMSSVPPPEPIKKEEQKSESADVPGLYKIGAAFFIFFNFDTRSAVSFIETAGTILYIQNFYPDCEGGSVEAAQSASLFFMYLGLGGFVVYLSCEYINRVVPSLTLLQISFLCFAAGMFLNVNFGTLQFGPENDDDDTSEEPSTDTLYPTMPKWKFILANALIWSIASPLSQTMLISSFSRMLGSRPQGKWQGLIASAGSVGRIVSPVVIGSLLLQCTGCDDDPRSCKFDPDSDGDYDGKDLTNILFYMSGLMTLIAFAALTSFKFYIETRGKDTLAQINASTDR